MHIVQHHSQICASVSINVNLKQQTISKAWDMQYAELLSHEKE